MTEIKKKGEKTLSKAQSTETNIKMLNTKEVAEILRCSIPTARNIMLRYDFPLIMVGKNMRVSEEAFRKWAMQRHVS